MIFTIDEAAQALDEMAETFPTPLFEELNGGVNLLEDTVEDPQFPQGEMYILGEFCEDCLGRYINLYYGSFAALAAREAPGGREAQGPPANQRTARPRCAG